MKKVSTLEKYAVIDDWYFLVEERNGVFEGWLGFEGAGTTTYMFGMGTAYISKHGFLNALEEGFLEAAKDFCEEDPDPIQCDRLAEAFDYGDEVAKAFYWLERDDTEEGDYVDSEEDGRHVDVVDWCGGRFAMYDEDGEYCGVTDDALKAAKFLNGGAA